MKAITEGSISLTERLKLHQEASQIVRKACADMGLQLVKYSCTSFGSLFLHFFCQGSDRLEVGSKRDDDRICA